jgi:hypothetical protein
MKEDAMRSMPTLAEGGELEPTIRRALAWLERNGCGVFWGRFENEECGLKAQWDVDVASDVEAFLALANGSGIKVLYVDCRLCEIRELLGKAKEGESPDLDRLTKILAPHAGELVEASLSWVGGGVVHQFTVGASWAEDYFEAWELAEPESDEDENDDDGEDGPDEEQVRRDADVLARDPGFQTARSAAQRSYVARRILDGSVVADKEMLAAVLLEAKNIFEVEIKPGAERQLVDEVQRLREQGLTKAQIARRLGISASKMKTMF